MGSPEIAINPNWVEDYKRRLGILEDSVALETNQEMIEQQPKAQEGER